MIPIVKKIPGFRTGKWWKAVIASVVYFFIFITALAFLIPTTPTLALDQVDPTNKSSISIAGKTSPGKPVYLSTNNGTNWTQTGLNNKTIWSLATLGNNIFAGTDLGVYLSTNNGTNWTQTAFNHQSLYSLATHGNNIFAGCGIDQGVWLSTNNGQNWTQTYFNNLSVIQSCVPSCITVNSFS